MTNTTTIEIATEILDELKAIGDDYNEVIRNLIHEHNCNQLLEEGDKLIREHRDEFINVRHLKF